MIHVEGAFEENVYTLRGRAAHARVDQPGVEVRPGLRIERALPLWSERLGLVGKADVVEFEADGTPYPVEYKQGRKSKSVELAACDELQIAAQALCLEEMTGHAVPEGALYYASSRRRRLVTMTPGLRAEVEAAVAEVRAMLRAGTIPRPELTDKCRHCSLYDICQPEALGGDRLHAARADLFKAD